MLSIYGKGVHEHIKLFIKEMCAFSIRMYAWRAHTFLHFVPMYPHILSFFPLSFLFKSIIRVKSRLVFHRGLPATFWKYLCTLEFHYATTLGGPRPNETGFAPVLESQNCISRFLPLVHFLLFFSALHCCLFPQSFYLTAPFTCIFA